MLEYSSYDEPLGCGPTASGVWGPCNPDCSIDVCIFLGGGGNFLKEIKLFKRCFFLNWGRVFGRV